MAAKIKSFGFSGDCGYNQLLYPVESQTRVLITWLVQRLPRLEEEQTEEIGPSAILGKRIRLSLQKWKNIPWSLHFCKKPSALDIYDKDFIENDFISNQSQFQDDYDNLSLDNTKKIKLKKSYFKFIYFK